MCKRFSKLGQRPKARQGKTYYKAIHFPVNNTKPKWIWLDFTTNGVDLEKYCGPMIGDHKILRRSPVLSRDLHSQLFVRFNDFYLTNGSKLNESIKAIAQGASTMEWRGGVVVHAVEGMDPYGSPMDMDMADYRHVVDFFSGWRQLPHREMSSEAYAMAMNNRVDRSAGRSVAVRITCPSDSPIFGSTELANVLVPKYHESLHEEPSNTLAFSSDICSKLNLPIVIFPEANALNDQPKYVLIGPCTTQPSKGENLNAASLLLKLDIQPIHLVEQLGTVLVIRKDYKPMSREQVEVLIEFAKKKIGTLLACMNGLINPGDRVSPLFREQIEDQHIPMTRPTLEDIHAVVTEK